MNKKIKEKILKGVAASPGISIGTPFYYVHEILSVSRETVPDYEIELEIQKYRVALEKTKEQILNDKKNAAKRGGGEAGKIFDAHLLLIDDQVLTDEVIYFISIHNVQAPYAVSKVMKDYQTAFEKMQNQYFSQRAFDIEDVCRRIVKNIISEDSQLEQSTVLKGKQIVVSNNIYPSDTLNFNKDLILGIVTEYGGKTSHAAILSRALEVPAVVGATGITKWIKKASLIIVDGYTGIIILNPKPSTFESYKKRQHEEIKQVEDDLKYSILPSITLDNQKIKIMCNIQSSLEIENVIKWNSDGVGLFRTEFLFESSLSILSEDEQFKIYDDISEKLYPREIVIRLLDIGGDKLNDKISVKEDNPFLGVRGMRLLFHNPDILKSHLRAILRASGRNNVSIIIPFVANITEINKTKIIIEKIKKELINEGYKINDKIKLGIMIEIPSVVMIADAVAKIVDYFSIGTNDLTQYVLAADRGNERVSYIYDSFHPAVVKMLDMTIQAAKKGNIPVGLCGQMAGYPIAIPLLLGLGLREFSVTPFLVPVVKKIIRRLDTNECRILAQKCLKSSTARSVTAILSDFFEKKIGENPLQ
ncbi:MAG: phosphoenolpyruvate--protein phosphotransferase [Candidatus Delongbacteria bacterium]|nr:phosphoenolpyruvate--protein phosphotransferase [Candidatus Delongbacteria bacterium]MCG2760749.1 phosphoenolpyruvate--protein phosphotransferase [Candidatus Delongbacteria bacterium]